MKSGRTTVWILLTMIGARDVASEFENSRALEVMEGPRVERMHPEISDSCIGSDCLQQSEGPVGAMWFGPRLGRRRRSEVNKLANKKIEANIGEILATPAWSFINSNDRPAASSATIPDDKRQETTFTPRLGRNLEDTFSAYEILHDFLSRIEIEDQQSVQKNQPLLHYLRQEFPFLVPLQFIPEIGRNQFHISSSLDHELKKLVKKLKI